MPEETGREHDQRRDHPAAPLVQRHAAEAKEERKPGGERKRPQEDVQAEGAIPKEQIGPDSEGRSHPGDADGKPCPAAHQRKMLPAAWAARQVEREVERSRRET